MAKKKEYINDIDWIRVYQRVPEITGLDLTLRGKAWEGRYYINGEPHPYKQDKLKVRLYDGCVWLHEQGGPSMSLPTWLTQYGGATDYKHAYQIIRGKDKPLVTRPEFVAKKEVVAYVSPDVLQGAKAYDLSKCPLFRWMCTLFPEDSVREVWSRYNVTTNSRGEAVFWYTDADGRICYDKVMRYLESGKRDKAYGGSRKFRTADGYTARPYFGAHLVKDCDVVKICESEKTAMLYALATSEVMLATGGKGNLKSIDSKTKVYPDYDAVDEWMSKCEDESSLVYWWQGWDVRDEKSDVGDMIVDKIMRGESVNIL